MSFNGFFYVFIILLILYIVIKTLKFLCNQFLNVLITDINILFQLVEFFFSHFLLRWVSMNLYMLGCLVLIPSFGVFTSKDVSFMRDHIASCNVMTCPCRSFSFSVVLRNFLSSARHKSVEHHNRISI